MARRSAFWARRFARFEESWSKIGGKNAILPGDDIVACSGRINDFQRFFFAQAGRGNGDAPARGFGKRRLQIALLLFAIGAGLPRVEFNEKIAGLNPAAILDGDPDNPARIERLDHLGSSARLDAALGDGVNLKPAEIGPGERGREEKADHPNRSDPHGRRGRLKKFERGGQKLAIHLVHAKGRQRYRSRSAAS